MAATSTWAESVLRWARSMPQDDWVFPPKAVDPANETIIGAMTPLHLGLYTLMQGVVAQADRLLAMIQDSQGGNNQARLFDAYEMFLARAKIVEGVLWYQLRSDFKFWNAGALGLREGGKVVSLRDPSIPSVPGVVRIVLFPHFLDLSEDLG